MQNSSKGDFTAFLYDYSSAQDTVVNLKKAGAIHKSTESECVDPSEGTEIIRSGDSEQRLVVWSPYWQIYALLGIVEVFENPKGFKDKAHTMIFSEERFGSDRSKLSFVGAALHRAWNDLSHNPRKLSEVAKKVAEDKEYINAVKRFADVNDSDIGG